MSSASPPDTTRTGSARASNTLSSRAASGSVVGVSDAGAGPAADDGLRFNVQVVSPTSTAAPSSQTACAGWNTAAAISAAMAIPALAPTVHKGEPVRGVTVEGETS